MEHSCVTQIVMRVVLAWSVFVCLSVCSGGEEDDDWEQALIDEYIAMQEEQKTTQNSSKS